MKSVTVATSTTAVTTIGIQSARSRTNFSAQAIRMTSAARTQIMRERRYQLLVGLVVVGGEPRLGLAGGESLGPDRFDGDVDHLEQRGEGAVFVLGDRRQLG